jgi:hypothetical protein
MVDKKSQDYFKQLSQDYSDDEIPSNYSAVAAGMQIL